MTFEISLFVKRILLFITSLIYLTVGLTAQGLNAYTDVRGNFMVFDKGETKTLEIRQVRNYKIGGRSIPYIDNLGHFKIYNNGKVDDITFGPNIEYTATDNLIGYYFNEQLWVYDNGKKELLSLWVENYQISDYTIAFIDNNDNEFSVYQNGTKTKLEDVLSGVNDLDYRVGENVVAYNFQDQFKIFINGTTFEISFNNTPPSYKVGKNIVGYIDGNEQSFNAFYLGKQYTIEEIEPLWYKVADDMIIYKNQGGILKAFYKGETIILSTNEPTNIALADNVCTFMDQERFMVFLNGETHVTEYFKPKGSTIENNSVIYLDQAGALKYFNGTAGEVITSEVITSYQVNLNTVSFTNLANRTKVFYDGRIY